MKSAAYAEMISKQILMRDYKLSAETADALLRRKQEKDLTYAREMGSIFDCIKSVGNIFHPVYQGEMVTIWHKGEYVDVPKAWWEARWHK